MPSSFSQGQLEALASVLVDATGGLTHAQIERLLRLHHLIDDYVTGMPKRVRLFNALARSVNTLQSDAVVRKVVEFACEPSRFLWMPGDFGPYRQRVNEAVAFVGWQVGPDGKIQSTKTATTLSDAQRRARDLRQDLLSRDVHPDVLAFCTAELLADDYFHMVLEATKSVFAKIRTRTSLDGDGAELVDRAFSGQLPLWVINDFVLRNERTEQTGFCNLLKGMAGMFRNPTAHEPRVSWPMSKADAEDLLSLASMIHRRLDQIRMLPRV